MVKKNKITQDITKLSRKIKKLKENGKTIVLVSGHFNVVHPGHLRFLEFAKSKGDYLLIALKGEDKLDKKLKDKFFSTVDRANNVASIDLVDEVLIFSGISFRKLIENTKPNVYVLGEEFSRKVHEISDDIETVKANGCHVIFSSGEIRYGSIEILDKDFVDIKQERKRILSKAIKKQNIKTGKLTKLCDKFKNKHVLVLGDTIVDEYSACDALGMSSEAPVLVVKELEKKQFIGGAAIVAKHVRALGAKCSFVSMIGNDDPGGFVKHDLEIDNVNAKFIIDNDRPTTYKIRYLVGNQKVLRVSRLKDHHISKNMETQIIKHINSLIKYVDIIIVSDFSYGIITPRILEHIANVSKKHDIKLFGDTQSSSQISDVSKFKKYFCVTPTEKEVRIALDDRYNGLEVIGSKLLEKTDSENVIITLGQDGFITFSKTLNKSFMKTQHFPALNANPIDVVGAGDSLLTTIAVAIASGASIMEASVLGAVTASLAVNKMGNIPINVNEIKNYLNNY